MKAFVRLLGAALLAVSLVACHAPDAGDGSIPKMQLKLYHVPVGQSDAIATHLGTVLEDTRFRIGLKADTKMRVTEPFPGTVMVLAPASVQPSIGQAISSLGEAAGTASKETAHADQPAPKTIPVRVHFWLVQAKAGKGTDASALTPLEPALKQVRKSLGPSHFVLNESISSSTNAAASQAVEPTITYGGELVTSRDHVYTFDPQFTAAGDVLLGVEYTDPTKHTIGQLKTELTMQLGQYVILASAPSDKSDKGTLLNLLVARVDRPAPASH